MPHPNVFDAKVIYSKVEPDGACLMLSKSRSVQLFRVPMFAKALLEEFVDKDASLWQTICFEFSFRHIH